MARAAQLAPSKYYSSANGKLIAGFVASMKPGDRHLSVREIASELSLNPTTVGPAMRDLVALGVVKRKSGVSNFKNNKGFREQLYFVEADEVEKVEAVKTILPAGDQVHFDTSRNVGPGGHWTNDNRFVPNTDDVASAIEADAPKTIPAQALVSKDDFAEYVLAKSQEIEQVLDSTLNTARRRVDNLLADILVESESRDRQAARGIDSFSDEELAAEVLRRLNK